MCLVNSVASYDVSSRVGWCIGILSKFSMGKNLLLKSLGTFFVILNSNPKLFKNFFFNCFLALPNLFILAVKLLWTLSASSNDKCPSYISL